MSVEISDLNQVIFGQMLLDVGAKSVVYIRKNDEYWHLAVKSLIRLRHMRKLQKLGMVQDDAVLVDKRSSATCNAEVMVEDIQEIPKSSRLKMLRKAFYFPGVALMKVESRSNAHSMSRKLS